MWGDSEFNSKDLRNVGNYTLGRMIGKGSFGKVYLATHKLTNGSKVCGIEILGRTRLILGSRLYSRARRRMMATLPARYTTIANSTTRISPVYTKSS